MRRTGEHIKASLAKRKLEIAEREKKILQRELAPTSTRSEARQTHPVSGG
jgi:hypothetical protein